MKHIERIYEWKGKMGFPYNKKLLKKWLSKKTDADIMRDDVDKDFGDKTVMIKKAVEEYLNQGNLNRLKAIYKDLPENLDDYFFGRLKEWFNEIRTFEGNNVNEKPD